MLLQDNWQRLAALVAYLVKEMHYTLQGEGARSGRAAVFIRFVGCNLWTGLERDRARAICQFCDTDFRGTGGFGGGRFEDSGSLADAAAEMWPVGRTAPYVVLTGGEPLLQVDEPLVGELHRKGFEVGIETNGTRPCLDTIDWVCVSPKAGTTLAVTRGHELKVVWPQDLDLGGLSELAFEHHWLQPMDGPHFARNVQLAVAQCLSEGPWRLSLQVHKVAGIP